jgi:hypothetical protein
MRKFVFTMLALQLVVLSTSLRAADKPRVLEKQPVFLFCPHKEALSSWSLYMMVDKNDPTKPVALGLEALSGQNSKESSYNGVLKAQKDPGTQRSDLGLLNAADFGRSKLEVKENNMLSIDVTPLPDGTLRLTIDARISVDQRFVVGGQEHSQRDIILQYSRLNKSWQTKALALENKDGRNAVGKYALPLTGIVFTASMMGISRIAAVDDLGKAILLMDR